MPHHASKCLCVVTPGELLSLVPVAAWERTGRHRALGPTSLRD